MASRPGAFLETIIAFLMPYFLDAAADLQEARNEVIDTLASYSTRTRAEMLLAAQTIAFGMTTLEVLAEARNAEMSPAMRVRHRGCANGLNRATIQTQNALDKRLAGDLPATSHPPVEQLGAGSAGPRIGPAPNSARSDLPAASLPEQKANRHIWAGAMMDTLRQMGFPVQPAPGG